MLNTRKFRSLDPKGVAAHRARTLGQDTNRLAVICGRVSIIAAELNVTFNCEGFVQDYQQV